MGIIFSFIVILLTEECMMQKENFIEQGNNRLDKKAPRDVQEAAQVYGRLPEDVKILSVEDTVKVEPTGIR